MNNEIRWIFFDVGTTLVDETKAYNHRIKDTIAGTDISFEQFQEKRKFFAEQNLRGALEAITYFGLRKTPWHKEDEIPYPDAIEVLRYLVAKGYKIGIIANQSPGTAERLKSWGLLQYIDVVAASAELGCSKPDREIFHKALEMAICDAQEAAMVGDRLDNDIFPAKKLGMKTVWIKQGFSIYQHPISQEFEPDYTVKSLTELKNVF